MGHFHEQQISLKYVRELLDELLDEELHARGNTTGWKTSSHTFVVTKGY